MLGIFRPIPILHKELQIEMSSSLFPQFGNVFGAPSTAGRVRAELCVCVCSPSR